MKVSKRLSDSVASKLGLEVKPKYKSDSGNRKYLITIEQAKEAEKIIQLERLSIKGTSTLNNSKGEIVMEWVKKELKTEQRLENLREAVKVINDDIIPTKPTKFKNKELSKDLVNQYTLTDFHLGMMAVPSEGGQEWDMKKAEETITKFFDYAIQTSPKTETAIFAQLGDFLHWDGLDAVTPQSKHVLDASTRYTDLVRLSIKIVKNIIQKLLDNHKYVHVIMAEGNHDLASSVWLRETFNVFYSEEPRVTIDTTAHPYYCFPWGKTTLFFHHAHKRKMTNVDTVFVSYYKNEYASADYVYGHTGHLHSMKVLETNLMSIEQHNTLAPKDAYAVRGGWNSLRNSKVITYHKMFGEVDRRTINYNVIK